MIDTSNLRKFTRLLFASAFVLLLYGYLCRIAGLYFFWESKTLGYELLFIGIISLLFDRIKLKKEQQKKSTGEKVIIGIVIFILLVQSILFFVIPRTGAYAAAKEFIFTDQTIRNQVGEVKEIFITPTGGMSLSSGAGGEYGDADLNIIVKGSKKYKDYNVYLTKLVDTKWLVKSIE